MNDAAQSSAPPQALDRAEVRQIILGILLAMLLAALDQTIVATALPTIGSELNDVEHLQWVVTAYLLAATAVTPLYGKLADIYGRRRMLLIAISTFVTGSFLCALAPAMIVLIVARFIQGLGGGGLIALAQTIVADVVSPRERMRYQAYFASVFVTASVVGPVVGGFFAQDLHWSFIFWINLPLGAGAMLFARRLPQRKPTGLDWRFDTPGLLFFILFVAPVLVALEQVRDLRASDVPMILGLVAVAAVSLVLLARRELTTPQPLFPFSLLRNPTIWRSDAMAACHGAALVSLIAYLPIYLRTVRGLSPSATGYFLLPIAFGIGLGSVVTGRLVSRTGRTAIFPAVSLIPVTLILFAIGMFHEVFGLMTLAGLLGVLTFFMGSVMGVVQVTVQSAAGAGMLGAAAGSVQFSRAIGASFGAALVGVSLLAAFANRDPAGVGVFADLLEQGPSALAGLPEQTRTLAQDALAASFRVAFLIIDAFAALTLAFAWIVPTRRL